MATRPKFIQITSTAVVAANLPQVVLHALDEEGEVWQWTAQQQQWVLLPDVRRQQGSEP
jgi:hypothetical protein